MKKKLWFVIILIIGIISILGIFLYVSDFENIPVFTALYISIVTAIYAFVGETNPNSIKKQAIYGKLKKNIIELISYLEKREYQIINFDLWDNIQDDERYHLFDEKLTTKLDKFLMGIKKYSTTTRNLQLDILPEIRKDSANEVFNKPQDTDENVYISLLISTKKKKAISTNIKIIENLKMKHTLSEAITHLEEKLNFSKEEAPTVVFTLMYAGIHTNQMKTITKFWNTCIRKIDNSPEHAFMVKEKDRLLEEAREIKKEIINHIKKTLEN